MPERIPQSKTIRVTLKAYLSSDHSTAATGKTIAVVLSKNGGAFGNPSGGATNATEIGNGWYYVDLSTTDSGTLGPLIVRGTSSGVDDVEQVYDVVKSTNGGYEALPDTACTTNASLITSGTGTDQQSVAGGRGKSDVSHWNGSAVAAPDTAGYPVVTNKVGTGTGEINLSSGKVPATLASTDVTGNIAADLQTIKTQTITCAAGVTILASVGTAATSTAQTGDNYARLGSPAGASIAADIAAAKTDTAAIKAKTDNLPASPAAAGSQMDLVNAPNATAVGAIQSGLATSSALATVGSNVTGIKAKTDNLPADPASTGDVTGMATTIMTHGDAAWATATGFATSSALSTVGSNVTGIKAKTDNLPSNPAAVGSQMDLVNSPNATAITAMNTGLATSAALASLVSTVGVAGAGLTAVGLASTGLDNVTVTPPSGSPSGWNFRQQLSWLVQRFKGKVVYDVTGNNIKVYAEDLSTVISTQTVTVSGSLQSQGHI